MITTWLTLSLLCQKSIWGLKRLEMRLGEVSFEENKKASNCSSLCSLHENGTLLQTLRKQNFRFNPKQPCFPKPALFPVRSGGWIVMGNCRVELKVNIEVKGFSWRWVHFASSWKQRWTVEEKERKQNSWSNHSFDLAKLSREHTLHKYQEKINPRSKKCHNHEENTEWISSNLKSCNIFIWLPCYCCLKYKTHTSS